MKRAFKLFREQVGGVRGKVTKRKVSRVIYDDNLIMEKQKQVLYSDIMRVDGHCFLVTVCELLAIKIISQQGVCPRMCA
jgi:hypothetical protein